MAMKKSNTSAQSSYAAAADRQAPATTRRGPATLGFINIGISTAKAGDIRRIDSIRLLEGNPLHELLFAGLNAQREDDPTWDTDGLSAKEVDALEAQRKALLAERLAGLMSKLHLSFNPARTDADNELVVF